MQQITRRSTQWIGDLFLTGNDAFMTAVLGFAARARSMRPIVLDRRQGEIYLPASRPSLMMASIAVGGVSGGLDDAPDLTAARLWREAEELALVLPATCRLIVVARFPLGTSPCGHGFRQVQASLRELSARQAVPARITIVSARRADTSSALRLAHRLILHAIPK